MAGQLHLVGSVPLNTPQEVFESLGPPLGKFLFSMPDGEAGPRQHWISRVHYQVLAAHPSSNSFSSRLRRTAWNDSFHAMPTTRGVSGVKDGVKEVRFGDPGWRLGYARDAVNSFSAS